MSNLSHSVPSQADESPHLPINFMPLRLGEMLIANQLASANDIQRGLDFQKRFGGRLGAILIRMGAISEDGLLNTLAEQLNLTVLLTTQLPSDINQLLTGLEVTGLDKEWCLDQELVVWAEDENAQLCCLARDPLADTLHEVLDNRFPERITWFLARNQDLDKLLDLLAKARPNEAFTNTDDVNLLRELAEGAPVVEFVNNMFSQAIDRRASDVHVEPEEHTFFVRYRIDGVLYEHLNLPRERFNPIASRIKLISGLDIAERRLPQDGRLNTRVSGQDLDIRVSCLPGVHGESIVMRLLPKERQTNRLDRLGFANDHLELFKRWISEPHGIILVTGPTGSGKSTTLYAALDEVNDRTQKIITVEDPVEYQLKGVTQVQAHSDIGYTFASALRAILRQDPDIIMLGEIRDRETAEIAIQASLTGHMVLSTLHTNDAVSAFTRLVDMGVEPFLVATSVRAVQAQRLVRRLCPHCAKPSKPLAAINQRLQEIIPAYLAKQPAKWMEAVGCTHCQGTGYQGRVGIYELVYITTELQSLVLNRAPVNELRRLALREGFRNLREDGWLKAYQGITSIEEVLRVTDEGMV
ncbi:type II secretory pathway, ATPase PulE/Tfp pilus assembly pathway, ATPase PilB [Beggiatoa alba B18LD]|uniref:Type II secretory pathway, ATPase PulE/Tfp pilus assembly pathway, ATPase PilB n=1 Tax=Beggiatoa alba B18LD TaxID=395493 RepID=I3CBL8_9GAMM|nr:GspE/PulE family protein [Beggiatoa alba]EIJ41011.1 type II secretory pathway, ATPase PulE/Tfp pilus assembly pathway, ATPase PilB [Beggiatoa alba B18LD]